jgi:hypothetical protein
MEYRMNGQVQKERAGGTVGVFGLLAPLWLQERPLAFLLLSVRHCDSPMKRGLEFRITYSSLTVLQVEDDSLICDEAQSFPHRMHSNQERQRSMSPPQKLHVSVALSSGGLRGRRHRPPMLADVGPLGGACTSAEGLGVRRPSDSMGFILPPRAATFLVDMPTSRVNHQRIR